MATSAQTTYRAALERGHLTMLQSLKARRRLVVHIAIENLERRPPRRNRPSTLLRAIPSLCIVLFYVASSPSEWRKWVHMGRRGRLRLWRGGVR